MTVQERQQPGVSLNTHQRATARHPLCQVPGCHIRAARAVEIDLPAAWEATQHYTTLTVVVGLCLGHGREVAGRVEAVLEARSDLDNLLTIVEAAVAVERDMRGRADRAGAEAECQRVEADTARQDLRHVEAELRLACRERAALDGTVAGYRRALAEAFNSGDGSYRP